LFFIVQESAKNEICFIVQDVPQKSVLLSGKIDGLKSGLHGFHVHEKGELGNDCKDAGPHFNPFGVSFHIFIGNLSF
jgi:Cu-Zn family superoxide dismutase